MMKRKLFKDKIKKINDDLHNKKRRLFIRSLILALFVLGVNSYAWFIFITKADVEVGANVVSWNVNFSDNSSTITNIVIDVDLYPGMDTFTKEFFITNSSNTGGTFSDSFVSLDIMGQSLDVTNMGYDAVLKYLNETFPFIISINASKRDLAETDNMNYTIDIDWPLDYTSSRAREYYRLTPHYTFDPSVKYYTYNGSSYEVVDDITEDVFLANKESYYLEKDDADSFWGSNCQKFKDENNTSCFKFELLLRVTQKA